MGLFSKFQTKFQDSVLFERIVDQVFDDNDLNKCGTMDFIDLYVAAVVVTNKVNNLVKGKLELPSKAEVGALYELCVPENKAAPGKTTMNKTQFREFMRLWLSNPRRTRKLRNGVIRAVAFNVVLLPLCFALIVKGVNKLPDVKVVRQVKTAANMLPSGAGAPLLGAAIEKVSGASLV
ncbi:hypothetical protein CYMTET_52679 [Cymbomonas tetramitiformis]|uniref:EF-hand domain-containing protein n=1 Tax=Cymbomonas tetramitiformis TaxID=36881 RepID=A0AAE0EQV0_9CHLO|nr:hypothetical protein CYMTET_52679 [Cymbomonas tetramitiformis]